MVRGDGPTGDYAGLAWGARITSTAFTVPITAQTFTVSALLTGTSSAGTYVYVLSGPDYGTVTQALYAASPQKVWTTHRFDASKWRDQSIKLAVYNSVNLVYVDNLAVSNVLTPQWDGGGVLEQMAGGPSGKYISMTTALGGAGSGVITSTGFTIPTDADRLKLDVVGSAGTPAGKLYVYVAPGPTYSTRTQSGTRPSRMGPL